MKTFGSMLVLLIVSAGSAVAADRPDALVMKHLDSKGTPYKVDKDNDFKVTVNLGDGRTQQVFVLSNTNVVRSIKVREIWTPGYRAADEQTIPVAIANRLLEHSNEVILGSWVKQKGGYGIFVIKVPADASADDLDSAIDTAASSADELEREFSGTTDEF